MYTKLLSLSVAVAAALSITLPASASTDKEVICHPNNGASGWSLIDVSKESSHFGDDGTPKHTAKDGRTDVLAVNSICPSVVIPTTPVQTTEPTTPVETTVETTTVPTEPPGTTVPTTTVPTITGTTSTTTTDSPPPATTQTAILAPPVVSTRPPTQEQTPVPQVPTAIDAGIESAPVAETPLPDTGGVDKRLLALAGMLIGLGLVGFGMLALKRKGVHAA